MSYFLAKFICEADVEEASSKYYIDNLQLTETNGVIDQVPIPVPNLLSNKIFLPVMMMMMVKLLKTIMD